MINHKRFFICLSLVALSSLLITACASAQPGTEGSQPGTATEQVDEAELERRKTLIIDGDAGPDDPENLNPYAPGRNMSDGMHQAMLEPLFILNYETGEIEPWVGESMTSNDTLDVWTLKLHAGVKWSDGEAYNADDVVFSINMLIENAPELAGSAQMADWVASVEKIDDLTVQFNLTRPNPRFQLDHFAVRIWGSVNIVPEHVWSEVDPLTFKNYDPEKGYPIYSGAYLLESVSDTDQIYVRNDDWWGVSSGFAARLPHPEKLIWTEFTNEETRAAAMADDLVDSLSDMTVGGLLALKQRNPNVITHFNELPFAWVPDPCSRTFEINNAVEPWSDPEMRWALNYAIDRDEIITIAYEGSSFPSLHPFPAYPPLNRFVKLAEDVGLYEKYPMGNHDPELAKEIFESKGYTLNSDGFYEKDGQELTLDISTHQSVIELSRVAQVMVEQFINVGINATQLNQAGALFGETFNNGTFESRVGWHTCGSINEPWNTMDAFNPKWTAPVGERATRNAWRWTGENADKYGTLVDEIGTLPLGDPKIDELFLEATELWLEELPVIPVTEARKIVPYSTTYWTNWPTAENNYMHPPIWWQSTHKMLLEIEPTQ